MVDGAGNRKQHKEILKTCLLCVWVTMNEEEFCRIYINSTDRDNLQRERERKREMRETFANADNNKSDSQEIY